MTAASTRPLTRRQRAVLRFVADRIGAGRPPTLRQIAAAVGTKYPFAVVQMLRALARKGYVSFDGDAYARPIRLVGATVRLHIHDTPEGRRLAEALGEPGGRS